VLQDAHEFLNYLLNQMAELLEAQDKAAGRQQQQQHSGSSNGSSSGGSGRAPQQQPSSPFASAAADGFGNGSRRGGSSVQQQQQQQKRPTWVHEIFQGRLVSETRCLQCETLTRREEVFMDLSLEIDHNTSITACLKQFRCVQCT
jgi:ubiquitin carboxyl-terminal hydrolase 12/46